MEIINNFSGKIYNKTLYHALTGGKGIFLDIETTGLKRERDRIYLIGIMYPLSDDENPEFNQRFFFADDISEEKDILSAFFEFLDDYGPDTVFITFNGNRFDIPFIKARCDIYGIPVPDFFSTDNDLDIYKLFRPYAKYMGLSHSDQKSLEKAMGVSREDIYSGGELIKKYEEYTINRDKDLFNMLITHNRDDVLGMSLILPVLSYIRVFEDAKSGNTDNVYLITDVRDHTFTGFDGSECTDLCISFTLPVPVPIPKLFHNDRIFLELRESSGILRIPVENMELKHYFNDYKNYYYIPSEDRVIIKTLGKLMDSALVENAKADNCYVRYEGKFLPLPKDFSFPEISVYSNTRKDVNRYVRFEEIKNTPDMREYLLNMLIDSFS